MSTMNASEETNLATFLAEERLGIDDVILRLGDHAIVHYYDPVSAAPRGERGLNARFDLTDNIDLPPEPA